MVPTVGRNKKFVSCVIRPAPPQKFNIFFTIFLLSATTVRDIKNIDITKVVDLL